MNNNLKDYFPMIRSREEVRSEIHSRPSLEKEFEGWKKEYQDEFLDFVTGVRGVKMLYDSFFKEIFNPETVPERLNELLSLLLKRKVKILHILPTDNSRLADDVALVIMDIVILLEDGNICNVEVQKIGYAFPGERAACYSSDLLLRQYKTVRDSSKQKLFSYRDIKTVYTIVFLESSPQRFKNFPDIYLHHSTQKFDTGLQLNLLQEYLFIPLDIFQKNLHNKGIQNKLDAWLTFLSSDDPDDIISVIEKYPEFRAMYEHVYYICQNMERVMEMFSEELRILDRNTVHLMIDQMNEQIEGQKKIIEEKDRAIEEKDKAIEEKDKAIEEKDKAIEEKDKKILELQEMLSSLQGIQP